MSNFQFRVSLIKQVIRIDGPLPNHRKGFLLVGMAESSAVTPRRVFPLVRLTIPLEAVLPISPGKRSRKHPRRLRKTSNPRRDRRAGPKN